MTPLYFPVQEGDTEIVRLLLESGADLEWDDQSCDRLIEMARERGDEWGVARLGQAQTA